MIYLSIITFLFLLLSFFIDKKKTIQALKIAFKKFTHILIPFLFVLILVSTALYLIPETLISRYLSGDNQSLSTLIAAVLGSITMIPGFIAFPLSGILKMNGVSYMVLSAFTTTLMMVGVLTFPVEKKYFGTKVALTRNLISFAIALLVALVTGLFFRELI